MQSENGETQEENRPERPSSEAPLEATDARPSVSRTPNWNPGSTRLVAALLMAASLVAVLWNLQMASLGNANTGSRYATIHALVDYGTYQIDKSPYAWTPDKVKAGKHFISSKPPLLPTYGAGIYYVLKNLFAVDIVENEGIVVWAVSLFTGWLGHLVFLIYFYRISRLFFERELTILVALAGVCFAYLGMAYATAINNHSVGAAIAMVGLYHAIRARRDEVKRRRHFLLSGFWLGVLPAINLPSLAFTGLVWLYLLQNDWKRTLLFFTPAAIPGVASQLVLAHVATGSFLPAYMDSELKDFAGNYWKSRRSGIDALKEPKYIYAFNMLIGHHGIFSMTPLFCFSIYEVVRRVIRKDRYRMEAGLVLATFLVVLTFYVFKTRNYGGWCVGMRWLVPEMGLLMLFFGFWVDRVRLSWLSQGAIVLAFSISAFHVQDALSSPFQFSVWQNFLEGKPNRNRIADKWHLSKKKKSKSKSRGKARTRRGERSRRAR